MFTDKNTKLELRRNNHTGKYEVALLIWDWLPGIDRYEEGNYKLVRNWVFDDEISAKEFFKDYGVPEYTIIADKVLD